MTASSKRALIVVDMQNDFCPPNGSLAIAGGRDIVPQINQLLNSPGFAFKVATQDYHPQNHISFASNHPAPNNRPFESFVEMRNVVGNRPDETMQQRLWPDHCVQGTEGANLVDDLEKGPIDLIVQKGMDERVEMYSAFTDNFGNLAAGAGGCSHDLAQILHDKGISDVFVVGIAGDYCVRDTAFGAAKSGFRTYVIEECQRSADPAAWLEAKDKLNDLSVEIISVESDLITQLI